MKCISFDTFGPPTVVTITDRPVPEPGPGEVVVRVAASTINPTDLMMRRGEQAALMKDLVPPYVAGMEFTGHIHAVGSGVLTLRTGQPVLGVVNPRRRDGGAHAEFVRLNATQVATLPPEVDLIGAATIPMNALTAMAALELTGLRSGQVLLVTGGAGMLGGSVLQLARDAGLIVVANAAPADADIVRSLGADVVLPRDTGLDDAFRSQFTEGAHALIDGALIGAQVSGLVRAGGVAVALRKSHPIPDPRLRCVYVSIMDAMARPEFLSATAERIGDGVLRPRVAPKGIFPFREAVAANRMAEERGHRGRVVLTFDR